MPSDPRLTYRQLQMLKWLVSSPKRWYKPRDLGAWSGSHHSVTLTRLVDLGLVERKQVGGGMVRPAWAYRITADGAREVVRNASE